MPKSYEAAFIERLLGVDDESLLKTLALVTAFPGEYRPEAIAAVKDEVARRSLTGAEVKEVDDRASPEPLEAFQDEEVDLKLEEASRATLEGLRVPVVPLPLVAKIFAVYCCAFGGIGVFAFVARTPLVAGQSSTWLAKVVVLTVVSLAAGIGIFRRARFAPTMVWMRTAISGMSVLGTVWRGLLVQDVLNLIVLMLEVWFALWYQKRRRFERPPRLPAKISR